MSNQSEVPTEQDPSPSELLWMLIGPGIVAYSILAGTALAIVGILYGLGVI